jgi:hypothetical protein
MDANAREQVLSEFRKMCAEAFHYAMRNVSSDLARMDTDTHPRFKALEIYLTEGDATERSLRVARYAAELMAFHLFVMIEGSEIFDIVSNTEGLHSQSVPEMSELFPQEILDALEQYSEYGSAAAKLDQIYVELTKQK